MKCIFCNGKGKIKHLDEHIAVCRACDATGEIDFFTWLSQKWWDIRANHMLKSIIRRRKC